MGFLRPLLPDPQCAHKYDPQYTVLDRDPRVPGCASPAASQSFYLRWRYPAPAVTPGPGVCWTATAGTHRRHYRHVRCTNRRAQTHNMEFLPRGLDRHATVWNFRFRKLYRHTPVRTLQKLHHHPQALQAACGPGAARSYSAGETCRSVPYDSQRCAMI